MLQERSVCRMSMISQEPFQVQKHHLDTNHHVNNCQYICMAEDFLPEKFKVYQMRAEYKMQAKLGDMICPKTKVESGKVVVSLDDEKGEAVCNCGACGEVRRFVGMIPRYLFCYCARSVQ